MSKSSDQELQLIKIDMSDLFKGLGVAMVTPFDSSKEIDYDATDKLL